MSTLSHNLKHLYQRRSLWPVYGFFALIIYASVAIPLCRPRADEGYFIGLIALQFLVGLCTTSLAIEVLTKPFSYCLPGHQAVSRKFILLVGVATSFLGSVLFITYPRLYVWERPLVICSASCAGLTTYCLAVILSFVVRNPGSIVAFISLPFLTCLFFDLHVTVELAVTKAPLVVISVGFINSAIVWIWIGDSNLVRQYCASSRIVLFDLWNQERFLKHATKQALQRDKFSKHPQPWVEQLFLGRINSFDYQTPGRYIWGALYTSFAMGLSQWNRHLRIFMWPLALALLLSYTGARATSLLFFIAGAMVMNMPLPAYPRMIICVGRKERFYASIVLVASFTLLALAVMAILAILSITIAPIMPDMTIRSEHLTFHATSPRLLIIPAILIPISLTLRLFISKEPFSIFLTMILTIAVMFVWFIYLSERFDALFGPILLASLLILSWLILVIVLRHICMKRSLVGQSRTY